MDRTNYGYFAERASKAKDNQNTLSICGFKPTVGYFRCRMIKAKKSLGQHFLVDAAALRRIAESATIRDGDTIIEIGPGTGLLTKELLRTQLKHLIAYEVDDRAIEVLQQEIADPRFELRHEDFLQAEVGAIERPDDRPLRVVGNIPYYITSPIIFKLIDDRQFVSDAVLLVQLEVAERLTAAPRTKAYGIPSVLTNFFGEVEFLFKIKAGSFRPAPKVDSALIRVDFTKSYFQRNQLQKPEGFDDEAFRKLVRTSFGMRRKTLRNNLKAVVSESLLREPELASFLPRRAEELSVEEFIRLFVLVST